MFEVIYPSAVTDTTKLLGIKLQELQSTRKKLVIKFKSYDNESTVEAYFKIDLPSTEWQFLTVRKN